MSKPFKVRRKADVEEIRRVFEELSRHYLQLMDTFTDYSEDDLETMERDIRAAAETVRELRARLEAALTGGG